MRSLLALLLASTLAVAADRPAVDHAAYTSALKDFRKGAAKSIDALKKSDASISVRLAAVDDVRERLVDEPNSPLTGEVAALLGSTDVEIAKLLLAALAEAKAAGATPQVAALAAKADSPLRVPAALALAEVGGAKAVPVLLECQKALLKLAQPPDLAALRDAEQAVTNETTKGALGRLIKKLEGVK